MTEPARPPLTVVGLGPAGAEHLTTAALEALAAGPTLLRTRRHPSVEALEAGRPMRSFDALYDELGSFEEVYAAIVEQVVAAAAAAQASGSGPVVYAVPGSPLVAEATVELLVADPRVSVTIVPALSFVDLAWARLGVDPVSAGVRLVDGSTFAAMAAGERGPLLVAQCWSKEILSAIKLSLGAEGPDAEPQATVLHHLGLPDERVVTVGWWELDRVLEPDHLTSLWIPQLAAPIAGEVVRLEELVRTLRQACPWDRAQTHLSLTGHLLEESYEALDALEALGRTLAAPVGDELPAPGSTAALSAEPVARTSDLDPAVVAHACEELGDVLFQVVFHSVLASEEGLFTLADVAHEVHRKLVFRHPHVFGDVEAATPDAVVANWEELKKAEKGRASVTEGIPWALPALALAGKLQRKATAVGLSGPALEELRSTIRQATEQLGSEQLGSEPDEASRVDGAVGGMLLAVVELARRSGVDPEAALRHAALALRERIVAAESAESAETALGGETAESAQRGETAGAPA